MSLTGSQHRIVTLLSQQDGSFENLSDLGIAFVPGACQLVFELQPGRHQQQSSTIKSSSSKQLFAMRMVLKNE